MFKRSAAGAVLYGNEAINQLEGLIREINPSRIFFLVDENTHDKCLPLLLQSMEELPETEVLEVASGEDSKSAEVLVQLWYALSELGADRQAMIVNVGGGMITDLGGFLAGTYLRGIPFVNVPTSLLAMVDASAGGKNGINLDMLKNRVGLFLEPEVVCILTAFLETLPQREVKSGFAEMLKHGLIADPAYWDDCSGFSIAHEKPSEKLVKQSVEIKSEIVKQDFREGGFRKILNFGHTIGHAIESASLQKEKPLLHGEAIALGMMAALQLSVKYTGLNKESARVATEKLQHFYGDLAFDFTSDELLNFIRNDKKNVGQEIRFSLLKEIGKAVPDVRVSEDDIKQAIEYLQNPGREQH